MVIYKVLPSGVIVQSAHSLISNSVSEGCAMFYTINEHKIGIHASVPIAEDKTMRRMKSGMKPAFIFCVLLDGITISDTFKKFCAGYNITIHEIGIRCCFKRITFIGSAVIPYLENVLHSDELCVQIEGAYACPTCNTKCCIQCCPNYHQDLGFCVRCGNVV